MFRAHLKNGVSLVALLASGTAFAADNTPAGENANSNVFGLGVIEQVTVTGSRLDEQGGTAINESTLSSADIFKFNTLTVDKALDLVTGASSSTTGGPRNEKLLFVRGFDRFQSPLFVDGIRVYLPADNRLDLGFFVTSDLAQIQVEKGYVSVLSGPGALGGAVNLVTRKPTQDFEYEARGGLQFGGDGSYNGYTTSGLVGGRTGDFYLQASGAVTDYEHFRLSDKFTPTASEDGGDRDHTASRNYGVNLKVGYTPNATDEYSLSYSGTWGKKDATFSVVDPISTQKDWTWPYWDIQSVYFLSNTAIGSNAYVKTKAYYNTFRNGLYSYDNANYNTQTTAKAFRSYYADDAYGASIEGGYNFGETDTLKGAFFYRRDDHVEWQDIFVPVFTEPHQESIEDTYSVALENRLHVTDQLDFVTGASYDWRKLFQAQDYVDPTATKPGVFVNYPLADGHADNGQAALIYNFDPMTNIHASVSDRARFPTLFDRFSSRFGSTISNPSLKAERAVNYEIGGGSTFFGDTHAEGAVYYSDISDALETVPIQFCDTTSAAKKNCTGAGGAMGVLTSTTQTQNVGNGKYYGFEFSVDSQIRDDLLLGIRYTYINRNITEQNPLNPPVPPTFHLTGVPYSQAFIYLTWDITPSLSVTPNIQLASDRWTNNTAGSSYFKTGSFALWNLQAQYDITDRIGVVVGGRNLLDQNYTLQAGFPQEGRNFFLDLRVRS